MKRFILILFILNAVHTHAQDLIMLRDSSVVKASISEISQTDVKYHFFDYADGPLIIKPKSEIAYITFKNGTKEVFTMLSSTTLTIAAEAAIQQKDVRVGDYIKFNTMIGGAIYNSFSNVTRQNENYRTSSTTYSKPDNTTYRASVNVGFNFLFGRSPFIKHVISINYLHTKGNYNYSTGSGGWTSTHKDLQYTTKADFINISTGLRFSFGKKIHFEPLVTLNCVVHSDDRITGSVTTSTHYPIPPAGSGYTQQPSDNETEYFNNAKAEYKSMYSTVSLSPRLIYTLPTKKFDSEIYFSYNISYGYRLPWYLFGVNWYPFKKLK